MLPAKRIERLRKLQADVERRQRKINRRFGESGHLPDGIQAEVERLGELHSEAEARISELREGGGEGA